MPVLAAGAPGLLLPAPEPMTAAVQPQPPRLSLEQPSAVQARPTMSLSDLGAQQRNTLPPRPAVGSDPLKRGVNPQTQSGTCQAETAWPVCPSPCSAYPAVLLL